jgi:uncharacterized membrane protein (DUF4010 family)
MTFLALPVLPDRFIDPWNSINPHQLWLMTVLVAGLSFAGYVAVKLLGARNGILITALAGGLASSTATTLALARLGKGKPEAWRLMSAGILGAGAVMVVRVGSLTWILNSNLFEAAAPPLAVLGGTLAVAALVLFAGAKGEDGSPLTVQNPLAFASALKLGAFIGVVMLAAGYLRQALGEAGVLGLAIVSGIADTDAITLSMTNLAGRDLPTNTAALAVGLAVAANTLSKAGLAAIFGGAGIGLAVGGASLVAVGAAAVSAAFLLG